AGGHREHQHDRPERDATVAHRRLPPHGSLDSDVPSAVPACTLAATRRTPGGRPMLDLGLTGKVAIVTGGSAGLGRAAALRLAREGARVSICARRKEVLERTAGEIRQAGGDVLAIPADVTRAEDVEAVVKATTERFGG